MTKFQQFILKYPGGWIMRSELAELREAAGEQHRVTLVIVRCGCGRFFTAVQDVEHFIEIIERENSDYVRDISIPKDVLDQAERERDYEQKRGVIMLKNREWYGQEYGGVLTAANTVVSDADPGL